MKATVICGSISFAIVATVALVPGSSWVFRNHMDLIAKRGDTKPAYNRDVISDVISDYAPSWLLDPQTYRGSDPAEQLTHALLLPSETRDAAIVQYSKEHPRDPLGWAVLVRMTCMKGTHWPDAPQTKNDPLSERKRVTSLQTAIDACNTGEDLEPNNAYFPLMRAEFNMELNRLDEMRKALGDAASKTIYDNHVREQGLTMEKAQILAKGYRGELVKIGIDASILLPDFAHIKALGRYINRNGGLAEKRNLIQTIRTMSLGEDTGIGFLVAFADLRLVLREPIPINSSREAKLTDSEWGQRARDFDGVLQKANVAPPAPSTLATYQTLDRLVKSTRKYIDSLPSMLDQSAVDQKGLVLAVIRTVGPYVSLTALLFLLPFIVVAWLFSKVQSDAFRQMLPHLVCLPMAFTALLLLGPCQDCSTVSIVGILFGSAQMLLGFLRLGNTPARILAAITALVVLLCIVVSDLVLNGWAVGIGVLCVVLALLPWFTDAERRKRIATVLGVLLVAASFISVDAPAILGAIAFGVSFGLLWRNKSGEFPRFAQVCTVGLCVLLISGAGIAVVMKMLAGDHAVGFWAGCLICLYAASLYSGKTRSQVAAIANISLIFFSSAYLVTSGIEVRENHRQSLSDMSFMNEAENIRKLAGVPKTASQGQESVGITKGG